VFSTKALFTASDIVARLVLVGALLCALVSAFPDPDSGQSVASVHHEFMLTFILCVTTALGAFLVSRRHASGMFLLAPTLVVLLVYSGLIISLVYLCAICVMALPFVLVLIEARQSAAPKA
jgi:hypothetical protein